MDESNSGSVAHRIIITSEHTKPEELKQLIEKELSNLTEAEQQKIIVWNRTMEDNQELARALDKAINEMNFLGIYNIRSRQFIKVVDDIRFIKLNERQGQDDNDSLDIVFIYNTLERTEAKRINDLLSTILKVRCIEYENEETITLTEAIQGGQSSGRFYLFYSRQNLSQMVEVYQATQKALTNPDENKFLLVTDNLNESIPLTNMGNTRTLGIESDLLPLEIKMQFDAMNSGE